MQFVKFFLPTSFIMYANNIAVGNIKIKEMNTSMYVLGTLPPVTIVELAQ